MDEPAPRRMALPDALDAFRAAVLADVELQDALQGIDDTDRFISAALAQASARGFFIEPDALRRALREGPQRIAGCLEAVPSACSPQQPWLPIDVADGTGGPIVDWAYFGSDGPAEPFFQDSVRKALRRPINRLARHRTALRTLGESARSSRSLHPSGFIFHMSRCGSTLVSQMLAQDRHNVVISEAPPLDAIVRSQTMSDQEHAALLASMICALGRKRAPWQKHYFIKLDSWHILDLPLFRSAFPDVPWIFLYREPSEVLASQVVQRGVQTVPEYLPASVLGLSAGDAETPHDYCALILRQICRAALAHYPLGGGLLINYADLPQALWTEILPHLGVACSEDECVRMARAAQFDAKSPGFTFAGESPSKTAAMTPQLMALANRRLGTVYAELNNLMDSAR